MKKKSSNACCSFAGILPDSFCTQQVPSPLIFPYFLFSLFTFLRFFCLFLPSNRSLLQETTHSAKQPALGSVCHPSLKSLRGSKLRRAVGHALLSPSATTVLGTDMCQTKGPVPSLTEQKSNQRMKGKKRYTCMPWRHMARFLPAAPLRHFQISNTTPGSPQILQ
jgi:hypothetical protein